MIPEFATMLNLKEVPSNTANVHQESLFSIFDESDESVKIILGKYWKYVRSNFRKKYLRLTALKIRKDAKKKFFRWKNISNLKTISPITVHLTS